MFYGRGAGGDPTATAVLGDVVAVARHRVVGGRGPGESTYADLPVLPMGAGADPLPHQPRRRRTARACWPRSRTAFADHDVSIETVRQQLLSPDPDEPAATVAPASSSSPTPPPTRPCRPPSTPSRRCPTVRGVTSVMRVEGE